jgi:hypothetical protein
MLYDMAIEEVPDDFPFRIDTCNHGSHRPRKGNRLKNPISANKSNDSRDAW